MFKRIIFAMIALAIICSFGIAVPARPRYMPPPQEPQMWHEVDAAIYGRYLGRPETSHAGNFKWYNTGIFIKKGSTFTIKASGHMAVCGCFDNNILVAGCGPEGMDENRFAFYYGILRGRIVNKGYDYSFHVGKDFTETNVKNDGFLELNILPAPWVNLTGDYSTPSGKYYIHVNIK